MSKKRILVAMSGGVDSTVAAAMLLEQGYDVVGATLLFAPQREVEGFYWGCGDSTDQRAREAANQLGIEHVAVDGAEVFEGEVLRPAWEEYAAGRTPNPCVHCNVNLKLGLLAKTAEEVGAEMIATGHYARIHRDEGQEERVVLKRGLDPSKDQSYFLFALRPEQLARTLFPLGELTKVQVREEAGRFGLKAAHHPESQDACFGGEGGGFAEALRLFFEADAMGGPVLGPGGEVLGTHPGIHNYTVGQRKGIGIATGRRSYVCSLNAEESTVTLSHGEDSLLGDTLLAAGMRWNSGAVPSFPLECRAQIRYRHKAVPATVMENGADEVRVEFEKPQRAITPGQAVVFYAHDTVIGGGWIS